MLSSRWNGVTILLLSALVSLGGSSALAQGDGAEDFLKSYYKAMSSAKGPLDIEPFLAKKTLDKNKPTPEELKELGPLFAEMIKSTHPGNPKIVSKKDEGDKVIFQMQPGEIPPAVQDMAKQPTFSMKGEAIVVKEDGKWKIYKDYWTAEANGKDGSSRMSFGTDPDKTNDNLKEMPGAVNDTSGKMDYSSQVRDLLMEKWKQDGVGKKIYLVMKIMPDGKVSDVNVRGESPQKVAEDQIKTLVEQSQPLPAMPDDIKATPYVWMMFDWEGNKGRCISGPYFEEKAPDWVLAKMGVKSTQ